MVRSGLRALLAGPAGGRDPSCAPLPEMVRRAGELSGWLLGRHGAIGPLGRDWSASRGVAGVTFGPSGSSTVSRAHEAGAPPHPPQDRPPPAGALALGPRATPPAPRP